MIKTERLELVPLNENFAGDMFELWSDKEVVRYTNMKKMNHVDEAKHRIRKMTCEHGDGTYPNHFVILSGTEVIGVIGFPIISFDHFRCGFYYQLKRKYWGRGYTYEAAKGLLKFILETFGSATIYAVCVLMNKASVAILEKLGFKQEYEQESEFFLEESGYAVGHYVLQSSSSLEISEQI